MVRRVLGNPDLREHREPLQLLAPVEPADERSEATNHVRARLGADLAPAEPALPVVGNPVIDAGDWVDVLIGAPSGTVSRLACQLGNREICFTAVQQEEKAMRALGLSGGGAAGSWQAGAVDLLWTDAERRGDPDQIVSGTSVGALNASILVQDGPGSPDRAVAPYVLGSGLPLPVGWLGSA